MIIRRYIQRIKNHWHPFWYGHILKYDHDPPMGCGSCNVRKHNKKEKDQK